MDNETTATPKQTSKPADGKSVLNARLAVARNECPDCGRLKARNADDARRGDCDKWYAVRDKEARQECADIAAQKAANVS